MEYSVVAVNVGNREGVAQDMQRILTEHGCVIKVRLGLHDIPANSCSPAGLVLMEVDGESAEITEMVRKLNALPETSAKYIVI
ncbi:MAG TPA: hypothetical protein VMC79_03890 [Rectinemataceae bacterium]|nr:hypothetical protein [Rectinemataceae bacterium]